MTGSVVTGVVQTQLVTGGGNATGAAGGGDGAGGWSAARSASGDEKASCGGTEVVGKCEVGRNMMARGACRTQVRKFC